MPNLFVDSYLSHLFFFVTIILLLLVRSLRDNKFSSIWGFNLGDDVHFLFQFRGHEVRGIGRDGHVVVEGLESDHWVAVDIGK